MARNHLLVVLSIFGLLLFLSALPMQRVVADDPTETPTPTPTETPTPTATSIGSVSGTIYQVDGITSLPYIAVSLRGDNYQNSICTDENGDYMISGVPLDKPLLVRADSYRDSWCDAGADYIPAYWQETLQDGPTLLTVTSLSPNQIDIDLSLEASGSRPVPNLTVFYQDGKVDALDWPMDAHVKLKIEDTTTPLSPDYSAEMDVTEGGVASFDLNGQFEIEPGMIVSVSGAYMTAMIVVDNLSITSVDPDLDVISGGTAPNNWLWMFYTPGPCCRSTVANGSGLWTMDFSVPGPNGEPIVDIAPGSDGAIHAPSGDGKTSVVWSIPPATPTPTVTQTPTATVTKTSTPTSTPTVTKTPTLTPTRTRTNIPSPTRTPTRTLTRTPTRTSIPAMVTFISVLAQDGWILESSENGNTGGALNAIAATFNLGDDVANRQYRAILSFNTSGLPDNAIVQSAVLKIQQNGLPVGVNPFNVLGNLWVDIRQGPFGTALLQLTDFNIAASAAKVTYFNKTPVGSVYSTYAMSAIGRSQINKTTANAGLTQFRLYFATDDNNNLAPNYMRFLSGNAASGKPMLVITYSLP